MVNSRKRYDDLVNDFNSFFFHVKYGVELKYLIVCGAIAISGYGLYLFYSS